MSDAPRFDEKDPAELVPLAFNFASDLATGETLSGTPTVTVTAAISQQGATLDPTPSAILNGPASLDSTRTKVVQPVTGGLAFNDYLLRALCATTNANKTLVFAAILPVRTA
jgi:hypothetical protein